VLDPVRAPRAAAPARGDGPDGGGDDRGAGRRRPGRRRRRSALGRALRAEMPPRVSC